MIMKKIFMFPVIVYRKFISPLKLKPTCRFYPTCSTYSIQAFEKHGVIKGFYLTVRRLLRCNPFNPGGVDYVPEEFHFFKKKKT